MDKCRGDFLRRPDEWSIPQYLSQISPFISRDMRFEIDTYYFNSMRSFSTMSASRAVVSISKDSFGIGRMYSLV